MRPIDEGMTWTQLEIDGHFFALRDPGSVTEVMSQIEAIARTEPSFLTIATAEGIASVLITPHTRVFVRTQSAGDPHNEWDPSALPPDWDLWRPGGVDALAYTANAPTGLYLIHEPANTGPGTSPLEVVA